MGGWDTAQKVAESHKGGGIFARLENDKDKISGVLCGQPHVRELYYNETTNKFEPFTPELEKAGKKSNPKFSLNFYVPKEEAMKVVEVGIVTFKDLLKARDKYGFTGEGDKEVGKACVEIERQGAKGNKKTTYSVLYDTAVDEAMRAKIVACELHDLAKVVSSAGDDDEATDMNSHDKAKNGAAAAAPKAEEKKAAPAPATEEAMSADDITALATRMKAQPKANIDKFLSRFGIQKFRDLKAKDKAAAVAFIDELEGKKPEAPAAPAEVDPFA